MNYLRIFLIAGASCIFFSPVSAQIKLPELMLPNIPKITPPEQGLIPPLSIPKSAGTGRPTTAITKPETEHLPSPAGGRGPTNTNDPCRNLTDEEKAGIRLCTGT
jgi:hypothetical protein